MSNGQMTPIDAAQAPSIAPIDAPQAPSPPVPLPPPISGYGDPKASVRKLVTFMKEKKTSTSLFCPSHYCKNSKRH